MILRNAQKSVCRNTECGHQRLTVEHCLEEYCQWNEEIAQEDGTVLRYIGVPRRRWEWKILAENVSKNKICNLVSSV